MITAPKERWNEKFHNRKILQTSHRGWRSRCYQIKEPQRGWYYLLFRLTLLASGNVAIVTLPPSGFQYLSFIFTLPRIIEPTFCYPFDMQLNLNNQSGPNWMLRNFATDNPRKFCPHKRGRIFDHIYHTESPLATDRWLPSISQPTEFFINQHTASDFAKANIDELLDVLITDEAILMTAHIDSLGISATKVR